MLPVLKNQYYQYIDNKLKPYINQEELTKHKNIFLDKNPLFKVFKNTENVETLKIFVRNDYRSTKAKELGLPSFEQWQKTVHNHS